MTTTDDTHSTIEKAFYRILFAMARVALNYGVSAGAVGELVRRAFVDAAEAELHQQGIKPLSSRVCTLTGLYRKEVVRVKALPSVGTNAADDRYNRSARVVTGWTQDSEFCTKRGKPATLPMEGPVSFSALVRRYSGDMTPRSVLEELQRLAVVEVTQQQRVKLLTRAYIPATSELDALQILGTDVTEMIDTIRHNIKADVDAKRFQRKVVYLHIPQRHVKAFKDYATKESQALLEKLDRWLARKDTEHVSQGTPGSRLGLGIYVIESKKAEPAEEAQLENQGTINDD
ncbi:MAG: hypothetical protein KTR32_03425 [Granulosicoccus sp.]|nr:hypothetical protein [Granulosicoccus sp.]